MQRSTHSTTIIGSEALCRKSPGTPDMTHKFLISAIPSNYYLQRYLFAQNFLAGATFYKIGLLLIKSLDYFSFQFNNLMEKPVISDSHPDKA